MLPGSSQPSGCVRLLRLFVLHLLVAAWSVQLQELLATSCGNNRKRSEFFLCLQEASGHMDTSLPTCEGYECLIVEQIVADSYSNPGDCSEVNYCWDKACVAIVCSAGCAQLSWCVCIDCVQI